MLSKGRSSKLEAHVFSTELLSLFVVLFAAGPVDAKVQCQGSELSASNNAELSKMTEKECTHVVGDIVLKNLIGEHKFPQFLSIKHVQGSIIIKNTSYLDDAINFQNLAEIIADKQPALQVEDNRKLYLAWGGRLRVVRTNNKITYLLKNNGISPISPNLYNVLYYAAFPRSTFLIDTHMNVMVTNESFYKAMAAAFGFMSLFLAIGLIAVACYGRIREHED
ncbi:unnamed protein product [Caenorhabditis bovis]|uniref:Receptor L-domain domain-containing protein n=1 Tax=Caenorhabditis bovis TaxID=2654633 RepID=A0A8S1F8B8_9PELO|nr:unnamed protein product [Caenorhabditis bovis]